MKTGPVNTAAMQQAAKRSAKDSVFRDLFENPKYLFQLYLALHPEDVETKESDLEIVTIENILVNQMYNDLGFTAGKEHPKLLILMEASSTWSVNIAVRILMYLSSTWKEYIQGRDLNVYSSKKIPLPKPELYVIYTGPQRASRQEWISLADEFFSGGSTFLDARVKVIYDGSEGDIINQYVVFTNVFNDQIRLYGRTRKAILETIRICKDKNVLKEYLDNREKEVIDIMGLLFDQEYAVEAYATEMKKEGIEEGIEKGVRQGVKEGEMIGKMKSASLMKEKGFSTAAIADIFGIEVNVVQQWLKDASTFPQ